MIGGREIELEKRQKKGLIVETEEKRHEEAET